MSLFPDHFDETYFQDASWPDRVSRWIDDNATAFTQANRDLVDRLFTQDETGLRMVVNITADALLSFLDEGSYRNLYDRPVIGGEAPTPSPARKLVDKKLQLGEDTYFGAVALGGTGIRYYGEYSMVLRPEAVDGKTPLLDRDSYDLLMPPLSELNLTKKRLTRMRGTWEQDVRAMVLLRVLPEIRQARQLVTSGTVSELVLRDQEFVEVHRRGTFTPEDLEEVRTSPDEVAIENLIRDRERRGSRCTAVEHEWLRRRSVVSERLEEAELRHRVVTLHGRGYQWA